MEIQGSDIFIEKTFLGLFMVFYSPGRTTSYPEAPPDNGIRYHYLGGGNEVGNVGCVFEDNKGTKMLLDYGLAPTDPPKYPIEAPSVKDAVITHSHIDHLGMAPWLCSNHRTILHGTPLTAEISHMMWNDSCLLYTSDAADDL